MMQLSRFLSFATAILTLCCIARIVNAALIVTPLVNFDGAGAPVVAPLVQGTNGDFYGSTFSGGSNNLGRIFKMTPNGAVTTLALFDGTNGANPVNGLIQGRDGNLYGASFYGGIGHTNGDNGYGTLFRMAADGGLTTLIWFNGTNGANPAGPLIQSADGNFYGTTAYGGPAGLGTIFEFRTNSALVTLFSFNGTNGANPAERLIRMKDGSLYGTAYSGGASNLGTVFRLSPDGTLTTLASFYGTNGAYPLSGLTQGTDGYFYGTTRVGGTNTDVIWIVVGNEVPGAGTIFKVSTNGTLAVLASFNSENGATPAGALVQGPDGTLYGTTQNGGALPWVQTSFGTVFQITTNGTLTDVIKFNGVNGYDPHAGLILASDGNLYGTTQGNVFRLTNAAPPVFQSVSNGAGQITFTWSAITGQTYEIDYTIDLVNWQRLNLLSNVSFSTMTNSDAVGPGSQRFYRVVLLP